MAHRFATPPALPVGVRGSRLSPLDRRPEFGRAALDGVAVGALEVAPAAGERCRDARGDLGFADRPIEPVGGAHVGQTRRIARRGAERPGDPAEPIVAVCVAVQTKAPSGAAAKRLTRASAVSPMPTSPCATP